MISSLNLQHLKFFFDTINYKSVSEAAKMNFVTQSAVSQGIAKLEKVFHTPLLFFNRQGVQLTPEGEILYHQAKILFKSVQETFEKISEAQEDISGVVRFATTKSLGMSLLPPIYQKLKIESPGIKMQFKMGGPNLIRSALKNEEAEFAITVCGPAFDQFEGNTLFEGKFHLYQAIHAPKKLIEEGVLIDRPEGLYTEGLCEHLKFHSLTTKSFSAGWEFVARCTDLGLGVGFLPDFIVRDDRYRHLKPHPFKIPEFPYRVALITTKGTELSRVAQHFIDRYLK